MSQTFITLLILTVSFLSTAQALNFYFKKRHPQNETFKKVTIIIKTWWMIFGFLLLSLATAPIGLVAGFALISIIGSLEYYKHSRVNSFGFFPPLMISSFIILQYSMLLAGQLKLFQLLPILYILTFVPPVIIFKGEISKLSETLASLISPIIFSHFLACLPALYIMFKSLPQGHGTEGAELIFFIVIVLTEGNDVSQFIFGKLFGRYKIIPHLSPNKTDAGFIGGLAFTTIISIILFSHYFSMSIISSALLGVLISFYGIMGDLFFSAVKRYFSVKDFSQALPGHGGYLDRLDSLMLTAPITYYFFLFYYGGL